MILGYTRERNQETNNFKLAKTVNSQIIIMLRGTLVNKDYHCRGSSHGTC